MRSFGVVAEFNPFHDGHGYLIEKAKEMTGCQCCVAAMSGDFTQRGEPAIFNKWERAKLAVENGCDLVFEIPEVFACASAKDFARGGVGVLKAAGNIESIVFGSETGDIDKLKAAASFISGHEDEINRYISDSVKKGCSYPEARENVLKELSGDDILASPGPNDTLAIEYLLAGASELSPCAVKRKGAGHIETATELRGMIYDNDPEYFALCEERYFDLVRKCVLSSSADELEELYAAGDGLGHKLYNEIRYAKSNYALEERVKSKVYTRTRITRLITDVLLGIKKKDVADHQPMYLRVLALNDTGAGFLKEMKKKGSCRLPVISNINKDMELLDMEAKNMISFDILSGDVYNIIRHNDLYENCDFVKMPFKL